MNFDIPEVVVEMARSLKEAGFQAYLVGGCVRDLILERDPKDWDIATDATPPEVQKIFPENVYENEFGTVGVKTGSENPKLKIIEITTFRTESGYADRRHPDRVEFSKDIKEDLARRDFTMNAIAVDANNSASVVDPYGGMEDIRSLIIRAVGEPKQRFEEDALRLMRCIRLATELDFAIEPATAAAVSESAQLLKDIAAERIRDELTKLLLSPRAADGIVLLERSGLLEYILPELTEGVGVEQNLHHIYTVFEHNVRALKYAADQDYSLTVRLASLLHDVGKPQTKRGRGRNATFYGHEAVGAKIARRAMERLKFPKDLSEDVVHLIRQHMFYYNVGDVSAAGVRRLVARVGSEYIDDLLKVREADRIGSGTPKAVPYKLRHLLFMIDKVKRDPISAKMLAINGEDIMRLTGEKPSPRIGQILSALLEEVLDDPDRNKPSYLEEKALELSALEPDQLLTLALQGKEKQAEAEAEIEADIRKKHRVK